MIQLRELSSLEDMIALEELQSAVWPGSEVDIVPGHICQGGGRFALLRLGR